jgi:hypothetical protein
VAQEPALYQRQIVYQSSVKALIEEIRPIAPAADFSFIDSLVTHGEPGIALSQLAWLIVDEDVRVRRALIESIRELVRGTSEEPEVPENLEEFAIPE